MSDGGRGRPRARRSRAARAAGALAAAAAGLALLAAAWIAFDVSGLWYLTDVAAHLLWRAAPAGAVGALLAAAAAAWAGADPRLWIPAGLGAGLLLAAWWLVGSAASAPVGGAGPAGDDSRRVVVAHYNYYVWDQGPRDEAFAAWVDRVDPDVIGLVEAGSHILSAHPDLADRYPHRIEPEPGLAWSALVLSKHPLELVESELEPAARRRRYVAWRTVIVRPTDAADAAFLFAPVHYLSPRRPKPWRESVEAAGFDGAVLRRLSSRTGLPLVIASDINSTPAGEVYRRFARASGLRRPAGAHRIGTWPGSAPPWAALPIDWIWIGEGAAFESFRVGPRCGSDHRPLTATISITPGP